VTDLWEQAVRVIPVPSTPLTSCLWLV
jgi:hypothetical protein